MSTTIRTFVCVGMKGRDLVTEFLVVGNGAISGAMQRYANARVIGRPELDIRDPYVFPSTAGGCAVITAAVTSIEMCEKYPEWSRSVNVTATLDVASRLHDVGWRVVLLSSSAAIDPETVYGSQKRHLEYCWEFGPVLRLPKVLHADIPVIGNWLGLMKHGSKVPGVFDNMVIQPIGLSDVVEAVRIAYLGDSMLSAAGESCTWLDVALALSRRVRYDTIIDRAKSKIKYPLMSADDLIARGWSQPTLSRVVDELLSDAIRLGILVPEAVLGSPVS